MLRLRRVNRCGGTTTETRFQWCGTSLCQERTSADVVTRRYYPEGERRPVANEAYVAMPNHLGSTRELVGAGSGILKFAYDYDAYGNPTRSWTNVTSPDTNMRYAGLYRDANTGLHLSTTRAYDPATAHWISRDAIVPWDYAYTNGNPVNWVDPDGMARSPEWMRISVPGQISWDNARTAWEQGNYSQSAAYTGLSISEQALAVATLGQYGAGRQALNALNAGKQCLVSAAEKVVAQDSILFRRYGGWLNSNPYLRIGWNWSGTKLSGQDVFRIAIGNKKSWIHWHWDLWK